MASEENTSTLMFPKPFQPPCDDPTDPCDDPADLSLEPKCVDPDNIILVLNENSYIVPLALVKMYKDSLFHITWNGSKNSTEYSYTLKDPENNNKLISKTDCDLIIQKMREWGVFDHLSDSLNRYLLMGTTPFLLQHQYFHVLKINRIYNMLKSCIDISIMGSGKTYTACMLARMRGLKLIVIGPKIAKDGWKSVSAHFRITCDFYSYGMLSSTKNIKGTSIRADPSIDLLIPKAAGRDKDNEVTYSNVVSDMFRYDAKHGALLVFDECHNLKNSNSMRAKRAYVLTQYIYRTVRSRVLFISGTVFDKIEHAKTMIGLLGYDSPRWETMIDNMHQIRHLLSTQKQIDEDDLSNRVHFDSDEAFEAECYRKIKEVMPKKHSKKIARCIIEDGVMIYSDEAEQLYWYNYVKTIAVNLCFSMSYDVRNVRSRISNAIISLNEDDQEILKKSFKNYEDLCELMKTKARSRGDNTQQFQLVRAILQQLESAKMMGMAELANEYLNTNPKGKVILCYSFVRNITECVEIMKKYGHNTRTIYGKNSTDERVDAIDGFQNGNVQALVINPTTCGTAIDLDAKNHDEERLMLISPSWRFINTHQTMYRIMRESTKGKAGVVFVYSQHIVFEKKIIEALSKKQEVLAGTFADKKYDDLISEEFDAISLSNVGSFFDGVE